jgi:hypothetical protein
MRDEDVDRSILFLSNERDLSTPPSRVLYNQLVPFNPDPMKSRGGRRHYEEPTAKVQCHAS